MRKHPDLHAALMAAATEKLATTERNGQRVDILARCQKLLLELDPFAARQVEFTWNDQQTQG